MTEARKAALCDRTARRVPYICTLERKEPEIPPNYRVCLAGPCGSGKTSLLNRWRGFDFIEDLRPTCGANFTTFDQTTPEGKLFVEQVWDTAGQEAYASLLPFYTRNASVVVCVFDIRSFSENLFLLWVGNLDSCPELCRLVLVLNKSDLADASTQQLQLEAARRVGLSFARGAKFVLLGTFVTSCLSGQCCEEVHGCVTGYLSQVRAKATVTIEKRIGNATDTETQTTEKGGCCG